MCCRVGYTYPVDCNQLADYLQKDNDVYLILLYVLSKGSMTNSILQKKTFSS